MAVGTTLDSGGTLDHWCEWDIGKEADGWHAVFNYRMARNFRGTKFLQFSRICLRSRKF